MTAATQDIKTDKLGTPELATPPLYSLPVAANTILYGGTMVAADTNGRAVPATTSAALMLVGLCDRQVNNLTTNAPFGAAGAQDVQLRTGVFYFANDGTVAASMVGQPVFALDDNTVTTNPTKAGVTYWLPFAGTIEPPAVGDFGFSPTDATKIPVYVAFPAASGLTLHATIDVPLATIQAETSATPFNIGPALPANAVIVASDINVIVALSGGGETGTIAQVQATSETAGNLLGGSSGLQVTSGSPAGIHAATGLNPYGKRGGQQLQMTLTATGGTLAGLTAGHLAVDIYYTILQ